MKIADTNLFFLPGTNGEYVHLATIHNGVREYMCFIRVSDQSVFIEEITGGHLSRIQDDELARELERLVASKGILRIRPWQLLATQKGINELKNFSTKRPASEL